MARNIDLAREEVAARVAEPSENQRDASVDVARGIAIIAIVVTHVLRGLNAAHLLGRGAWFPEVDRVLVMFELSVFAFVGGLFVAKSVSKRSLRTYLRERTFQFAIVYLMWTVLQGSVLLAASSLVNNPSSFGMYFRLWAPSGQLWYLPWLVLVTLLIVPLRPWQAGRAPWVLGLSAVLSIAWWGLDGGTIGTQGLGLVVFFVGGIVLGVERLQSVLRSISWLTAAVGGLALFAIGTVAAVLTHATDPTAGWFGRTGYTVAAGVVLSVLMSAAVLLLARATRSWGFVALCGRRSLDIFLAHIILAAGCRIILVKLGFHSVGMLVAAGLVAGVAGALVISAALRRVGMGWVFDGPKLPARWR